MIKRTFGLVAVLAVLTLGTSAFAAAFTPGDIVVYRIGDGTQAPTNIGNTVFLDEYTPAAIASGCVFCSPPVPVQSIQMPLSWVGNQSPLIAEGSAQNEGLMTLSKDGRFLVVPGFAATIGQLTNLATLAFPGVSSNADIAGAYATNVVTEADIPRVVGLVDGFGHIYTSTTIINGDEDGDEIRTAASTDGTNIWFGGGDGRRVKYTTRGSLTSTQVCANSAFQPMRAMGIYGSPGAVYLDKNNLFGSSTNTTAIYTNIVGGVTNIATVNPFGGALPVVYYPTNFVPIAVASNSSEGFVMFNLANANQGGAAPDTLYLADSAVNFPGESRNFGGALLKYCYTNNNWVYEGEVGGEDALGVTGVENNPTNITLYFTEGTNAALYFYTDTTGYGGNPQSSPDGGQSSAELLWTSQSINVRGIAVVPTNGDSGTITGAGVIRVGPPYGPFFRGPQGGPFIPSSGVNFSVANLGTNSTNYTVSFTSFGASTWLSASPASGTLASGAATTVNLFLNGNATNLNGGQTYTGKILFHTGGLTSTNEVVIQATITVDAFYVTPTTNFVTLGEPGGPFTPSSTVYVLSNSTPGSLNFSAFTSNNWTSLSCTLTSVTQLTGNSISGSVPGHAAANVMVSINSNANSLHTFGTYDDQLVFTNVSAGTQVSTSPQVLLQVGFGIFDDFSTYSVGNVVGQNNWNGSPDAINPVQIVSVNGTNEYVVPGGCVNANGTSQQPYKYAAAGPITNAFDIVGNVTNNVPTYAIMGMTITFTNAPTTANYIFALDNVYLPWNNAGIESRGGNQYSWTTELNRFQTGGGPEGTLTYSLGTQYQVYLVSDFVESNCWVFVNPGTNDFVAMMGQSPAVFSDGMGDDACPSKDCIGNSAQGWQGIDVGQYSACPGAQQPGYFITKLAASTNYVDVYNWLNGISISGPTDPFTSWETAYFTAAQLTNPAVSGANVDLFGTGMSNTNKFLAGFSGTNSAAYLHIISVARAVAGGGTNVTVTYLGASGDSTYMPGFASRTNILEYSTGTGNGSYTNSFQPTGQTNVLSGGTGLGMVTNMTDTAIPASSTRYYRVRVLLP